MKTFAIVFALLFSIGAQARASEICLDNLALKIEGQELEIKERVNDFGSLVRDSVIDGQLTESNVFLRANGDNLVIEVRLTRDQSPVKVGIDHHTEMEYLIELEAATNNVSKVEYSRHQEIDYGNPIPVTTEMNFQVVREPSCR